MQTRIVVGWYYKFKHIGVCHLSCPNYKLFNLWVSKLMKKIFLCIYYSNIFPSVLWQLLWVLVGRLPACKKLGVGLLMVTFWLELCTSYSSSCHHRLYYPITLSWNKIQNGDVLVPANPGPSGKWLSKRRETTVIFPTFLILLQCKCVSKHCYHRYLIDGQA